MTTTSITREDLWTSVEAVLSDYGLGVEEFLSSPLDALEDDQLRDLWLMVQRVLAA